MRSVIRPLAALLVIPLAAACSSINAAGLEITEPAPDTTVKGAVNFSVTPTGLPTLASVEYVLDGRPLGGPLAAPPYSYPWQSILVWDGPASVQAIGRDASGKILAESKAVPFTIANGTAAIKMISPDPAQPLKGTVKWSVEVNRTMPPDEIAYKQAHHSDVKPIEALMFFVDGAQAGLLYGSPKQSIDLDTTQLQNGKHELFVAAYSTQPGIPPVDMMMSPVTVDNGHTLREVRANWREIFLAPGGTTTLFARAIYTDGASEPLTQGVTYSSADPTTAAVDAKGTVNAQGVGVTTITVEALGHKQPIRVVVDKVHGFPHFTRDGQMVNQYDPARSIFVRDLFNLGPAELGTSQPLIDQIHAAAINTLNTGFYLNPADGSHTPDFETWRKSWDSWWDRIEQGAKASDMSLLLAGDDIARTPNEMNNSITSPWAKDSIQYAFGRARDSKRVIGVEMIDEASGQWGDSPTPTDGRWMKLNPPIPDTAFTQLMQYVHGVPNHPPVSWPILGIHGPDVARNWLGDLNFSDYTSHYWDILDWRRAYPWGASYPQYWSSLDRAVVNRYPVIQHDRPQLLLMSICGPYYQKEGPGKEFTAGQDLLQGAGVRPEAESLQVMYAAAMGMAGIRAYGYDSWWKQDRANAKIGDGGLQTGSDPFETGTDRWQDMSSAFNLTKELEPYLLQPQVNAVDAGSGILTAARMGPNGRMLMAINFAEAPAFATVDLRPYRYTGAGTLTRYRLVGAALSTETMPDAPSDRVQLAPSETAVWVFRPASPTAPPLPSVAFTSPLPDETLAGPVNVEVNASDRRKLDRVELLVDNRLVATLKKAPYNFQLDTTPLTAGTWHSLCTIAYNTAGGTSKARTSFKKQAP